MSVASVDARNYELLTQAVYQAFLAKGGDECQVEHNVNIAGRSGFEHQCDVVWRFKTAGVQHLVIVECKHYSENVSVGVVRDFFGVLHDIGNAQGVIVTKKGFQSGAVKFANHYGISLKLIRPPKGDDWEGAIQRVSMKAMIKWFDEERFSIKVFMEVKVGTQEAMDRLKALQAAGRMHFPEGPTTRLLDADGDPATEEFGWWIPKMVRLNERDPGGPYDEEIAADGLYVPLTVDNGVEPWPLNRIVVTYHVRNMMEQDIVIDAMDFATSVLQDYRSGDIEHFHRPT